MVTYMKKRKKRKKFRLKSSFKRFLAYAAVILILIIYGTISISNNIKEIKYHESFEYKINSIGYSLEDTKKMIEILPEKSLQEIVDANEVNEIYPNIIKQKYFLLKNYDEYVEYKTLNKNTSYEDVIAIVNVMANKGWYSQSFESNIEDGYSMIVNKFYYLKPEYERTDLVNIALSYAYADNKAASIVVEEYYKMWQDVKEELNVHLMVNSSYRSYEDQEEIYNSFKTISLKYADSYAARPGYSEHQTGLALDITSLEHKGQNEFKESEEYAWLKKNCYKYGFILRFPEGKESITGYNNESWHFRYVGNEVAKKIHDENITLDEYYAFYIKK